MRQEASAIQVLTAPGIDREALARALAYCDGGDRIAIQQEGEADAPSILLFGDPAGAARQSAERHQVSLREGLWHAALALSEASDLARSQVEGRAAPIVAGPESGAALLRGLLPDAPEEQVHSAGRLLDPEPAGAFDGDENGAAAALRVFAAGPPASGAEALWDRSLFFSGDLPQAECPADIDVTGRNRILVFGPFLALPGGRWRVTVAFDVCADAARVPLRFQFGEGADVAELDIQPAGAGAYEVSLEHAWPATRRVEVRLWSLKPAFHGSLKFQRARVTCL